MKLFIRPLKNVANLESALEISKNSLVLVTEQGELLPGQISSSFVSDFPGSVPKFTVTFSVRGNDLTLDLG